MKTYIDSQELIQYTLRMSKIDTSFFYFTLEANENIAFYSTLDFEKGQTYRDIIVHITPELGLSFANILKHLQSSRKIEILNQTLIKEKS